MHSHRECSVIHPSNCILRSNKKMRITRSTIEHENLVKDLVNFKVSFNSHFHVNITIRGNYQNKLIHSKYFSRFTIRINYLFLWFLLVQDIFKRFRNRTHKTMELIFGNLIHSKNYYNSSFKYRSLDICYFAIHIN
jgi:hypothetical protein